jgi:transcriptional regulator with XRE-family HTH domain
MTVEEMEVRRLALAARIRESREYLKLSQEEVAEVLGISRPAVTNIEQGTRKVESAELDRLARLFGCTTDYLLGNQNEEQEKAAFLARTFHGLSEKDLAEVAKFAEFLRTSANPPTKPKPRSKK